MALSTQPRYRLPPALNDKMFFPETKPMLDLSLLHQLISPHAATEKPKETPEGLVHALIEAQALATPEAVAVQFESSSQLTYRRLNELSNAVARQLVCGRGSIIPICIDRSVNLVISLLAVMKTGAAFVLLSPESPLERNRGIVEDVKAPFVVVGESTQGKSGGHLEIIIENLLHSTSRDRHEHRGNLHVHQSPSEIAYVIYTSGTTGRPKGVLLSHQAATTGLSALPRPDEPSKLRQLLTHSPVFSAAHRTILGTLSRGGTLCLASKENITTRLLETVRSLRIGSLEITPSMLKLINPDELPSSVTRVTLGGEPTGRAVIDAWAHKVELYNGYGVSECTQLNMRARVVPGQRREVLGKPSDSTVVYVLSPGTLSPVPHDVPGELCLGGDQVAEGYLNRPEKTSEAFIPNPFGRGRLYRTGDMVVIREDGSIELQGRTDFQIKIDGQRVEPNESNAIIQYQPGVLKSTVVPASVRGRKSLVAMVVPDDSKDWGTLVRDVRQAVRDEIPSFAIPRYWVQIKEIPATASGKTDLKRLVEIAESMDEDDFVVSASRSDSPSAQLDSEIREVLADVLSLDPTKVNPSATFQDLGGSSLDAIILASKFREIGFEVTVPDIMEDLSLHEVFAKPRTAAVALTGPPKPFSLLPPGVSGKFDEFEDAYPVTPLQEGILADSILGTVNYVYQRVYKIKGKSQDDVKAALNKVVQKNPILRTVFKPWKKSFIQMVKKAATVPWRTVSSGELSKVLEQQRKVPMQLSDSQVRATVLASEYLILEMHHSLFDFWSSQFIFADIVSLLQGQESINRTPFSAYVAYQQNKVVKDAGVREHWQKYLASSPETILELQDAKPDGKGFHVSASLGDELEQYHRATGITIGVAVHQAWSLTLAKHLSRTDVSFVTATTGRDAEVEGVLSLNGPTLCTVPFRVALDSAASVVAGGKALQSNLWDLTKAAHFGFRNAMSAASVKPTSVNTMVNVLTKPQEVNQDGHLAPVISHGINFTQYITLEFDESKPETVYLIVPFTADVTAAQALLDSFMTILKQMAANPASPLSELISPLVEVKPKTPAKLAGSEEFGLAHAAFEQQAVANPSRAAIRTKTGVLSYGEFNAKAEQFASHLIQLGVKAGDMIPLFMQKSEDTLIAIFGVLKAGAAFVPLDSHNPFDRNKFIITDVGASVIVTDESNEEECRAFELPMILPSSVRESGSPKPQPIAGLTPDSTAYAIYTSGSTGTPKGVLVPHSAVDASTRGMIEATAVTSEWVALWVLNYIFDASYFDVFTVFSAGAALCVAPQDDILSDLTGHINEMGVEQVMLTPTITKLIRGGPSDVPRVKVLNVCGEKIDTNILEWAKSMDVYNGYGPTEATILMTVSKVEPDGSLNSIGYPMKHVGAVIVPPEGGSLEPVPNGQVGELCVYGPQLAKGYLNRPDQTSAAFVKGSDGEPLYRTGDLARWADDGSLHCLGRKDYQIKLNGFRIELGEIENAMLHTGKVEASVVSVAQLQGKPQLVAFCVFPGDHKASDNLPLKPEARLESVKEVMESLTNIAHYMMPSLFLPFNSFPTLPSGKANRKELVKLAESMTKDEVSSYKPKIEGATEFVPISTEQEKVMRTAWSNVLGEDEESIGASSVFLSLGGDSIAAINVAAECRSLMYSISVGQLLAAPTLSEQAKLLKPLQKKGGAAKVDYEIPSSVLKATEDANIKPDDIEDIYPCGPGQIEFLTQGNKDHQFWNLTACRALPQDFDVGRWKEITRGLTAENQILRTFYYQVEEGGESSWYQIVLREAIMNWEELEYSSEEEKTKLMHALRDSKFEFGKPNVKYLLLTAKEDGSRALCIKVDHGSYDGTLLRIFDEQFTALREKKDSMPKIEPFKNYVDWIYAEDRQSHLDYWKSKLESHEPPASLPLDPVGDRLKFAPVGVDVDPIAEKFGVTASTMFQAAYSIVARKLTGSPDVLVDNLLTGRNADVDDPQMLNGTCANFLPFRTVLAASTRASAFLRDTQAAFWDSTENGAVGLHDIYGSMGKDRRVHSAKLLFCFQPFEPAPPGAAVNHMRWVVMAQSKVFMTVNYALMVEVQKTLKGYRLKLQWDSRAFSDETIDGVASLFDGVFNKLEDGTDAELGTLLDD